MPVLPETVRRRQLIRSIRPKQVKPGVGVTPEERGVKVREAAQFGPGVGPSPGKDSGRGTTSA